MPDHVAVRTSRLNRAILFMAIVLAWNFLLVPRLVAADPLNDPFDYFGEGEVEEAAPLDVVLQSIVTVDVETADNARTAESFGTSRSGSGVVLDTSGLIATVGYLIAEAQSISVTFSDGTTRDAQLLAFDNDSGLGLLRASGLHATVPLKIGDSSSVNAGDLAMIVPSDGLQQMQAVKVGKVLNYSGGWEYIIDQALHTYPPSTGFSGAALLSKSAELLGIGALVTIDIDIDPKVRVPGNVFVPVNSLMQSIGELLVDGRSNESFKPWMGLDTRRTKQGVVVSSLAEDGPARESGLQSGDIVVAVSGKQISGQIDFYKKVWDLYKPGDEVHLLILRAGEYIPVAIKSIDYYDWLRKPVSSTQFSELVE